MNVVLLQACVAYYVCFFVLIALENRLLYCMVWLLLSYPFVFLNGALIVVITGVVLL